jgi:hypothetical protein
MGKQWIDFRLKDMYAVKHSLQNVVRQKKREANELLVKAATQENKERLEMLEEDIKHEEWLVQKMVNEIEEFKLANGIN